MVEVLLSNKFLKMCKEIILDYVLPGCDILCECFPTFPMNLSPLFLRVKFPMIKFT